MKSGTRGKAAASGGKRKSAKKTAVKKKTKLSAARKSPASKKATARRKGSAAKLASIPTSKRIANLVNRINKSKAFQADFLANPQRAARKFGVLLSDGEIAAVKRNRDAMMNRMDEGAASRALAGYRPEAIPHLQVGPPFPDPPPEARM